MLLAAVAVDGVDELSVVADPADVDARRVAGLWVESGHWRANQE